MMAQLAPTSARAEKEVRGRALTEVFPSHPFPLDLCHYFRRRLSLRCRLLGGERHTTVRESGDAGEGAFPANHPRADARENTPLHRGEGSAAAVARRFGEGRVRGKSAVRSFDRAERLDSYPGGYSGRAGCGGHYRPSQLGFGPLLGRHAL